MSKPTIYQETSDKYSQDSPREEGLPTAQTPTEKDYAEKGPETETPVVAEELYSIFSVKEVRQRLPVSSKSKNELTMSIEMVHHRFNSFCFIFLAINS